MSPRVLRPRGAGEHQLVRLVTEVGAPLCEPDRPCRTLCQSFHLGRFTGGVVSLGPLFVGEGSQGSVGLGPGSWGGSKESGTNFAQGPAYTQRVP